MSKYNKMVALTPETHAMLGELAWRNRRSLTLQVETLIKDAMEAKAWQ